MSRSDRTPSAFDPELRRLAAVVVLGAIMTILDMTIINVAITTLGREFHTSLSTIQWVLTGYTLALAMTIPITGWAVQRFGGKTMWMVSLVLFIAGSILCGAAWSVTSLIVFRVVQAIGGGLLMPVGQTMLARKAGPERMGRVMAVVAVPAMLGPVLGPVIGGVIVDNLDWRWMFYVNVPICAVALLAAAYWLPRDTERDGGARLDGLGLLLLSPGLAALVYGLAETGNGHGITDARVYGWILGGTVPIVAFVLRALRRRERALVDVTLFRDRGFAASVGTLFIYVGAVFGVMFMSPVYLQSVRGDSPLHAGLLLAPMGLGAALSMPIAGRLTDRIGSRVLAVGGLVVVVAGLSVFTRLDATTSKALLGVATFVVGIGHGAMMPSLMAAAYQRLPKSAIPAATTASNIVVRVGSSFGIAVLAVVLQVYIRHEVPGASGTIASAAAVTDPDAPARLARAFGHSFWVALCIAVAAIIPCLLLPRRAAAPASVVEADGTTAEPVDDHA